MFLRQSTSQVVRFGPCLDKTDGVTEETALTLAQADMRLSKDGGAFAQKSAAGNATHDSDGWYSTTLSTTDTATVGILKLSVHQPANMLPVWETFYVVEEAVYDRDYAASATGKVDVEKWLGTAVSANTAGIPNVDIVRITNATNPANTLSSWLQTSVNGIADSGTTTTMVDAALSQADGVWNGAMLLFKTGANNGYSALVTDFDAASDTITFAPAVPNAVTTENYTLIKGLGWADVRAVGGTVQTAGDLAALITTVDTVVDAIKAATDNLPPDPADQSLIIAATDAIIALLPTTLVNGRMDSSIDGTGMESGAVDAVWAKAMTELGAVPGVTGTVLAALEWVFLLARNKGLQTATLKTLRNNADGADIATSVVSSDGTTFTREKYT